MQLRSFATVLFILVLVPCQRAVADVAPESLLPAHTCVYLRLAPWNDLRPAYHGTALCEVLSGDAGRFLGMFATAGEKYVMRYVRKFAPTDGLERQAFLDNLDRAGQQILRHGIILGLSVNLEDADTGFQFTLIFPHGGKDGAASPMQKLVAAAAARSTLEHKQARVGERNITMLEDSAHFEATWACWSEGGHFVVHFSAQSASDFLGRLRMKPASNLTQTDLYGRLAASRTYPPLLSGFVDVRSIVDQWLDPIQEILKDLGVDEVQGLTFACGFEGRAWRESYALYLERQRRGIWQLLQTADVVNVDQFPAIPADAHHVWTMALDPGKLPRPAGKGAIDKVFARASAWCEEPFVKKMLSTLGNQVVFWDTGTDPIVVDGRMGAAVQVKDANALNNILHGLEAGQKFRTILQCFASDDDVRWPSLEKYNHRGAEYWTVQCGKGADDLEISFVVRDGWLVLGLNPQAVKDCIERAKNKQPRWRPGPELRRAIAGLQRDEQGRFGKKVRILAMGEQSPASITEAWFGSIWFGGLGWWWPGLPEKIDAGLVPNPDAVARRLFPNVSFVVDDGRALRWESYSSLPVVFSDKIPPFVLAPLAIFLQPQTDTPSPQAPAGNRQDREVVNDSASARVPQPLPSTKLSPAAGKNSAASIRTVYVPMFQNKSKIRSSLDFILTRAVVNEIQLKTPFRVVESRDGADAELLGTITKHNKQIINQNETGENREVQFSLVVQVSWSVHGECVQQRDFKVCGSYVPELPDPGVDFGPMIAEIVSMLSSAKVPAKKLSR